MSAASLDYLVGAQQNRLRHSEAERLSGLEVHDHLKFCRKLPQFDAQGGRSGEVAAWPIEAGDEATPDRIAAAREYDRDRSGRGLCRCSRSERLCEDHGHPTVNQFRRERRKSLNLVRPAIFEDYITALHVAH